MIRDDSADEDLHRERSERGGFGVTLGDDQEWKEGIRVSRFNRTVTRHPWLTIGLFLVATLALAVQIPKLQIDTDVVSLMPERHPERVYFEWTRDYFDAKPAVVLIVVNEGLDGVFTPETLALIQHLSDALAALNGIEDDDVVSLSTVKNIRGAGDALLVERFFAEPPTTPEACRAIRGALFENPMMVGRMVTADGHAAAVGAKLRNGSTPRRSRTNASSSRAGRSWTSSGEDWPVKTCGGCCRWWS
jgi:hypothetical protein